ncbi:MAG TPA: hypothetical protein DCY13_24415 [Verrucomicrobiales bacterium]|nr:hypothetical protein [Verrucomicrobiales bacterium]
MKTLSINRSLSASLILFTAFLAYASCDHMWDAMDTAYAECSGTETGACSYIEGSSPIGCELKLYYNCANGSGTYPVFKRTWTGSCKWGSLWCQGATAGAWAGPHPMQTTTSQSCP